MILFEGRVLLPQKRQDISMPYFASNRFHPKRLLHPLLEQDPGLMTLLLLT